MQNRIFPLAWLIGNIIDTPSTDLLTIVLPYDEAIKEITCLAERFWDEFQVPTLCLSPLSIYTGHESFGNIFPLSI